SFSHSFFRFDSVRFDPPTIHELAHRSRDRWVPGNRHRELLTWEGTPMREKRCHVCGEVYPEMLEIRRIQSTGFCTVCAWSNPFCQPDLVWRWRGDRAKLPEVLAARFALPLEIIQELLESMTEEELFDVLAEMEDAGTLAAERERLEAERNAAKHQQTSPGRSA